MSGGGASVDETTGQGGQMRSALFAGLDNIDLNQDIGFTLYKRIVLPIDGFVFWVRADQLAPSASLNRWAFNSVPLNAAGVVALPANSFNAEGSLHHTSVNKQDSDESFTVQRMIFTSKVPVNDLAEVAPGSMYMAQVKTERFAFSTRSMWYRQAGLYHYAGDAVYPVLASQVVDSIADLNQTDAVVSNSLPIWLQLNSLFPIYPSFLAPDNIQPPYATIHIDEGSTEALGAGPFYQSNGTRDQHAKDVVRVTTYGIRNNEIMDWLDLVQQFTLDNPSVMGIMNSPVPRDAKRGQTEISTIAQKKVITFHANYYQSRARNVARELIREAFITVVPPADILVA